MAFWSLPYRRPDLLLLTGWWRRVLTALIARDYGTFASADESIRGEFMNSFGSRSNARRQSGIRSTALMRWRSMIVSHTGFPSPVKALLPRFFLCFNRPHHRSPSPTSQATYLRFRRSIVSIGHIVGRLPQRMCERQMLYEVVSMP